MSIILYGKITMQKILPLPLLILVSFFFPGFIFSQSTNDQLESQRISELIANVSEVANGITVDGKGEDWEKIPKISIPPNASIEGSRNITSLSLAPLENRFLVFIATRDKPSKVPWSFYINLNTTKETKNDFQIGFHSNDATVRVYSRYTEAYRAKLPGLKMVLGEVVEIEIPYSSLENLIKPELKAEYQLNKRNTFARVAAFTFDNGKNISIDEGISYTSYYLSKGSQSLDDDLPKPIESPILISTPVKEKWFVNNGSWQGTHEWEYDLTIRNVRWKSTVGNESKKNSDYFAWDTQIYSPVSGVVMYTVTDTEDGIPGDKTSSKGTNNGVWIQTDDGVKVYLVHMKKDSISVGKGKRVEIGTEIGRTGSSGRSTEPHIHLGAGKLHSVRFQNVKVGINGGDFDPWERTLDAWDIKRGYFFKGK
jgi:hypothetical protein